jgi:hypothetical protein
MPAVESAALKKLENGTARAVKRLLTSKQFANPPIDLNALGKSQRIGALRFWPMLGSAGLLETTEGYDIVINTDTPGATQKSDTLLPVESSDWNSLAAPLRFSIAHEIAHTLVLQESGGDPNKTLFFRHEEAIDRLCNDVAGQLLMPAEQIARLIGPKLFDAAHLLDITKRIRVSAEALTRRLDSPEFRKAFGAADGLVSFVQEGPDGELRFVAGEIWGVRAFAQFGIGPVKQDRPDRLRKFPYGRTPDDLKLEVPLRDYLEHRAAGGETRTLIWRGSKPNKQLKCELRFCKCSERPLTALLTVEVTEGPLEFVSQDLQLR